MTGSGKAAGRLALNIMIVGATLNGDIAGAELTGFSENGWHTWRVESVDDVPEWCCYSWNRGRRENTGCDLDKRRGGYGANQERIDTSGQVQVYALLEAGTVTEIRSLSPRCPVSSRDVITDLGVIAVDDSVEWLRARIEPRSDITVDALRSVAMHAGKGAHDLLIEISSYGSDNDSREEAIFWMAQLRIPETGPHLRQLMFADESPDIRRHAAFAYSQSAAADRVAALTRQGETDRNADVRSQAWFWLAQTDAPDSAMTIQRAIERAISEDAAPDVREQAVFALSQLPDGRAVNALIRIVENRNLSRDSREHALFWLAHSESDAAFGFLERLISGL